MPRRLRMILLAGLFVATLGVTAGLGPAAPVSPASAASTCFYMATHDGVRIYSAPNIAASVIKLKNRYDNVTGPAPCLAYYSNGYYWIKLFLAGGGYGYALNGDVAQYIA